MRVFIVRHAIAFERDRKRWPDDALRPLTAAGARRFREAVPGIAWLTGRPERVLSSPLVRARQTAGILTSVADWAEAQDMPELAPGASPKRTLAAIHAHEADSVVLVGHEPHLTTLIAAAIASPHEQVRIKLKKGGAACLVFDGAVRAGRGELAWLLTPRALRELAPG